MLFPTFLVLNSDKMTPTTLGLHSTSSGAPEERQLPSSGVVPEPPNLDQALNQTLQPAAGKNMLIIQDLSKTTFRGRNWK